VANPKAADALQLKAELLLKAQRHPEAARTLAQRIELGGDPRTLAAFQYRLGILLQDTLSDANAALPYLQAALPQLPDPLDALERVGRILLSQRQLTQAAEVYRRLVERSPERSRRAAHALTLGRLTDEAGDAPAAVALYKQVLELQPGEPEAISRLTALHEKLGQASELAAMLEAQSPRGAPQAQVVSLRLRAAGLYLKQNEPQKAASALRFALESDPNAIEAHSQLADLLIKESSQAASAIESYRQVIRLDPLRPEPYHALFKLYDAIKQVDRQFCAASVLVFLRQANAMEKLFVDDTKGRIPQDTAEKLAEGDLDALLLHPLARGVVGETLRKMGDQLTRLYPGDLDGQGLGRADKLKPDHAQAKPLRSILTSIGVDKLEIYQGKRGQGVTLENTDPPSAVIGPDLVRKFQTREQRFVMARAGLYLRQKAIVAQKLSAPDLQAVLAAAVKVVSPDFARLGPVDPELLKQVKKGLSNQALRDLKVLLPELDRAPKLDVTQLQSGLSLSADRTGLVYSGDIAASLALRAREATAFIASKLDTPESVRAAVVGRAEMLQLLTFSVSDDFFRLRQKLRMGLGGTAP
jgi:tetratricopeptide (TPR) repeat protein